jgi:hypothetical protein
MAHLKLFIIMKTEKQPDADCVEEAKSDESCENSEGSDSNEMEEMVDGSLKPK